MVICEKQVAIYRLIGQTVYIYHIGYENRVLKLFY